MPCQGVFGGLSTVIHELNDENEVADQRIIPHVMHAVQKGASKITVLSSDTDIFVMLMYYWDGVFFFWVFRAWVKRSFGDSISYISIHLYAFVAALGLCKVLFALHTLTSCDCTSKVGTKCSELRACPVYFLKGFGLSTDDSNHGKWIKMTGVPYTTAEKGNQMQNFESNQKSHVPPL